MLWVRLYPSGVKEHFPEGTYLNIRVTEPCEFKIHIQDPTRREVKVGVDADPNVVHVVRSNAKTTRKP
jgi:hypothetical protein